MAALPTTRELRQRRKARLEEEGVDCTCGERVLRSSLRKHRTTEKCRFETRLRELRAEGLVQTHHGADLRAAGVRVERGKEWRPPAWGRRRTPERDYTFPWAAELVGLLPSYWAAKPKVIRAALESEELRAALDAAGRMGGERAVVELALGMGIVTAEDARGLKMFRPDGEPA